jgi:hypothetical protein
MGFTIFKAEGRYALINSPFPTNGVDMTSSYSGQPVAVLNDIEMNCNPKIGDDRCTKFSYECLSLIRDKLPTIAAEAFDLLGDNLEGPVQLDSISEMLKRLWTYFDENRKEKGIGFAEEGAIRAVIGPLHALINPDTREIVDDLAFFLKMINNIEPHFEEEEALLRKLFKDCL